MTHRKSPRARGRPSSSSIRCIYCRGDRSPADRSRDHVIPQLLGRFSGRGAVLRCVCVECNNTLGRELESAFARDSFEAYEQVRIGQRSRVGGSGELRAAIRVPAGNDMAGALLALIARQDAEPYTSLLPQIGSCPPGGTDFEFRLPRDFAKIETFQKGSSFKILASTAADYESLLALVRQRVPGFTIRRALEPPPHEDNQVEVELTFTMDKLVFRVIAKIAFSYLAWRFGPEAALDGSFDQIRRFIRYGEGDRTEFAVVDQQPILLDDRVTRRQTDGHLVVLTSMPKRPPPSRIIISPASWKVELIAAVSLYNVFTYRIRLTQDYAGIVPVRLGHHFDWRGRSISELRSGLLVTPVS